MAGLYFAIDNPEKDDEDGWLHIIHSANSQFGAPCQEYSPFQDHINDSDDYYREGVYYRFITDEMKTEEHLSIPRIDKQRGEFLFYKQNVQNTNLPNSIHIKINSKYKRNMRKELEVMFSINSESLMYR